MGRLEQIEESYAEEYRSDQTPPSDIVVFNELRSCADLFRLFATNQLDIQPFFQRDKVWKATERTRFIDSLIKQLPIPSMCFGFDFNKKKWIVIDGLQRMNAIVEFLNDKTSWRLSRLDDIAQEISGVDVRAIREKNTPLHSYYEKVENLTIPITVIRCEFSNSEHMEYLFKIFHRLNAGGVRLNNQEIRNCIYSGPFNKKLLELDKYRAWNTLKLHINGKKDRFRSVELILRFFSFTDALDSYSGNLPKFLNKYMQEHRYAEDITLAELESKFTEAVNIVVNKFVPLFSGKKFAFSQIEAMLVGISSNVDNLRVKSDAQIKQLYAGFLGIKTLSGEALSADISSTDRVRTRIRNAIQNFSE
jgi:hypothetical protein